MPSLALFNCLNRADREKETSNYCFPSIVKNNGKGGLKLSKVRGEKWLAQTFRKDLAQKKVERTRMKILLSSSPAKPQQKLTTICLIICKHSTHTKLRLPAHCCVGLSSGNSRNKQWNSSVRQIGLTLVTNSRAIARNSWMARCSPRAPGFQPKQ